MRTYVTPIALLTLLCVTGMLTIASCGSGGSPNGELCDQCGDETDGRCQGELGIPPFMVPEGSAAPCNDPNASPPCELSLSCLRKLGSAQRRCFPFDADSQFRCDGERANPQTRTPMPLTPTPILSATPTPTTASAASSAGSTNPTATPDATPVATSTPRCGDETVEGSEECDGTDSLDICEDFCDGNDPSPVLCGPDCTFDFSGCQNPAACDPNGPPGG